MKASLRFPALLVVATVLFACNDRPSKSHGSIKLGDSSTIVTEQDERKLQDLVTDLAPVIPPAEEHSDTAKGNEPAHDTDRSKTENHIADGTGLIAEFGAVTFSIPNITGKAAGNKNLLHASGAVYTLKTGSVNGNIIRTSGNVLKVSQRYETVVVLKNNLGTLPVESLSNTTSWVQLAGANGSYRITGLDARSLETPDVGNAAIRRDVQKAAQRHHFSRKKTEEWVASVRTARSVAQKPFMLVLRSVMWKVDGKDEKGKPYSKQIRVDIPL